MDTRWVNCPADGIITFGGYGGVRTPLWMIVDVKKKGGVSFKGSGRFVYRTKKGFGIEYRSLYHGVK